MEALQKAKARQAPLLWETSPSAYLFRPRKTPVTLPLCAPMQLNKATTMKYRWIQKAQIKKKKSVCSNI